MKKIIDKIDRETFVISDHHFGHKNINKFEPIRIQRAEELGYNNPEQMMIDLWNKTVSKNDMVLYLGDFAFTRIEEYFKKLNGNKIFLFGNHDRGTLSTEYQGVKGLYIDFNGEELVNSKDDKLYSGIIKEIDGKKIMFYHYPLYYYDEYDLQKEKIVNRLEWGQRFYEDFNCELLIHGHVHSNEKKVENHINVSCESLDFTPRKIKDLIELSYNN